MSLLDITVCAKYYPSRSVHKVVVVVPWWWYRAASSSPYTHPFILTMTQQRHTTTAAMKMTCFFPYLSLLFFWDTAYRYGQYPAPTSLFAPPMAVIKGRRQGESAEHAHHQLYNHRSWHATCWASHFNHFCSSRSRTNTSNRIERSWKILNKRVANNLLDLVPCFKFLSNSAAVHPINQITPLCILCT